MSVAFPMRRVIIFTRNIAAMRDFYRDVIGLTIAEADDGWIDFDAGGARLALHAAGTVPAEAVDGSPHKVVFYAEDVAAAAQIWADRGAVMGKVKVFGDLHLCDGEDPDGNRVQLSNRA